MQVATNVAGTMNGGVRVERRSSSNINRSTRAKQNSRMLAIVIIAGIMCLMMVVMSAFAANLNQENNQLQKKNDYIQAEVDSLNTKINDASNINKIEKTAKNLYEKKFSSSEEEFPVGKIVIDFKKVEEACRNYKK